MTLSDRKSLKALNDILELVGIARREDRTCVPAFFDVVSVPDNLWDQIERHNC